MFSQNLITIVIVRKIYAWSDSTTVLNWLKDNGGCKTFVSNRVSFFFIYVLHNFTLQHKLEVSVQMGF